MIVGIDLGTTNSLISIWDEGKPILIKNILGEVLTPSVVGLSDEGKILVGMAAKERLVTHASNTTSAFKRYMGTDRFINLNEQSFRPEELSALVLKSLKKDAETYTGKEIEKAVISVPAFFNDTQRKATRLAGALAGLNVERLINEPTAAAIAYGLHQANAEKKFLIFDLGGGTFDVSILELFDGVMEVHASAGDNFLGGEDFVNILVKECLKENNIDPKTVSDKELRALRYKAEGIKRGLNDSENKSMTFMIKNKEYSWTINKSDYERMTLPLIERLRLPVERALRDSRLPVSDIDEIVLVGGATRMSLVQRLVSRMFGRLPLRHINPDEVVALGTAVQAGMLMEDKALDEVVFTDVSPYSLGIETNDSMNNTNSTGLFEPILERNTVIPASRMKTFYPTHDYQRSVSLRIYQGESRFVNENVFLGEANIELPKKTIAESAVDVRFSYDTSGLLEVDATVQTTGKVITHVIHQNNNLLSQEELENRKAIIAQLKIHPREDLENQSALNKANHIYEELLGDPRVFVGDQIRQFQLVLETQDPIKISRARKNMLNALEQFEF